MDHIRNYLFAPMLLLAAAVMFIVVGASVLIVRGCEGFASTMVLAPVHVVTQRGARQIVALFACALWVFLGTSLWEMLR